MSLYPHWTQAQIDFVATMQSYSEMKDFALLLLEKLPRPVVQVCGPISTGGKGSVEANMQAFHDAIHYLAKQSKTVFDQRPFEVPMRRLVEARTKPGYDHDLLNEFYLPLFESRHIAEFHFLPGWESSVGAKWEYAQAERLGIAIFHLSDEF